MTHQHTPRPKRRIVRAARLSERRNDPRDIDSHEDLPDNVKEELPEGAEQMFFKALQDAIEEKPDEEPGAWYAMAWEKVKEEYENTTPDGEEDEPGADWEKKESRTDVDRRVERFLSR